MNKFKTVVSFFNSLKSGQFVTRKMYMDTIGLEISETSADYYRCLLQRAGYLYDFKRDEVLYGRGIYYVSKTIPDISYRQVRREAYE
jgi:hypothetical protein